MSNRQGQNIAEYVAQGTNLTDNDIHALGNDIASRLDKGWDEDRCVAWAIEQAGPIGSLNCTEKSDG